jgi:D-alanyl-D-alanine dipeptidase
VLEFPVAESNEGVARIDQAAAAAGVDIAFSDRPHASGGPRIFLLRESLVVDLLAVAEALNGDGWRLRIEDGFRTREMQRALAESPAVLARVVERTVWETGEPDPPHDLLVRRLGALVASAPKLGTHMSASAVDVSVVDRRTGEELRRGGPYLEISERTPMASPFVSASERHVRDVVTACMADRGFVAYPFEFWHYSKGDAYGALLGDSPATARFGAVDIDLATEALEPVYDPTAPLSDPHELDRLLGDTLRARGGAATSVRP